MTPLAVASLAGEKVFSDLFSLTDEAEMGHIRLSREADLVVVAPATADLLAKMAHGLADDLASTALLATDKPVLVAPAMNPHDVGACRRRGAIVARLRGRRHPLVGPAPATWPAARSAWAAWPSRPRSWPRSSALLSRRRGRSRACARWSPAARRVEAIDPVRFIANRSSGKQGHAIAAALAAAGAEVTLVSGPVREPDPAGVRVVAVEIGRADARGLPGGAAGRRRGLRRRGRRLAGRASRPASKLKKPAGGRPPTLALVENPDILRDAVAAGPARPRLVIGFAAETDDLEANARRKLAAKGCDWILANDVSMEQGTFGGVYNTVKLLRADAEAEAWPRLSKAEVAARLVVRIATHLRDASAAAA